LRKLLVVGAHAVCFIVNPIQMRCAHGEEAHREETFNLVAVALANKMARIAFAILRARRSYREIPA